VQKRKKPVPLIEFARDLDPIRRDYFDNNRCELVINLLAISETREQNILADDENLTSKGLKYLKTQMVDLKYYKMNCAVQ